MLVSTFGIKIHYGHPSIHDKSSWFVSYKFVEALWESLNKNRPEHFIEIAALGTIADVGPLTDENRYIVKSGLENLSNTNHVGLKVLTENLGLTDNKIDVAVNNLMSF